MTRRLLLVLIGLATATPVAAQEWFVNRERFRYIGTRLTVDVIADGPGTLRILRGQDGWIRVAGRVPTGFAAAGLTDHDHLTLSAAGGPADYMIVVPEGVWIVVRLPDRSRTEAVGGHTRLGLFEWNAVGTLAAGPHASPIATPQLAAPEPQEFAPGLFTTYSADLAPETLALPDLSAVRSVSVRTGAERFRIATSRPLTLQAGRSDAFEIRPLGSPMDIVIEIPQGTARFGLITAGAPALIVEGPTVTPACGPFTRQWLSGGREWVTFTPADGHLQCQVTPTARHKG